MTARLSPARPQRLIRLGLLAGAMALASGCAGLYNWGGYDRMLYSQYKDPNEAETMRLGLTGHLAALKQSGARVAPGLYAELGTLYLERGDAATAISYYEQEKQAWPESAPFMSTIIKNLQRTTSAEPQRKTSPAEAAAASPEKTP